MKREKEKKKKKKKNGGMGEWGEWRGFVFTSFWMVWNPSGLRAEGFAVLVQNRFGTPRKNTGAKRKYERAPYETPSPKKYATDKIASSSLPLRTPLKALSISQPP